MVNTERTCANAGIDAYTVFKYTGSNAVCQSLQWNISGMNFSRMQLSSAARVKSKKRLCSSVSKVYKTGRPNSAGQSMKYIGISVPGKLDVRTENKYSVSPIVIPTFCRPRTGCNSGWELRTEA